MRRSNTSQNSTFILEDATIIDAAQEIKHAGLNVILIQGGEIPQTTPVLERVIPSRMRKN